MRSGFTLVILLVSAAFARAAETPIPPSPARWVTDTAGFMSAEAARSLDTRLEDYEHSTGHQLLVYIGQTTGGVPIDDWAVRAFKAWKVGRAGIDDGVVLFIMSEDRQLRIEVGYGLEGQVTDATASRIINDVIAPRIQAGDRDGAIVAGMEAIAGAIGGPGLSDNAPGVQPRQPREPENGGGRLSTPRLIIYGIIGVLFLIFLVTHPSLALFLLMNILSGRRGNSRGGWGGGGFGGGGGGFGGGGFSGGGGRSGGGGASGSW